MPKLTLVDIDKTYSNGEVVHALQDVSLKFRDNEFVSVLGPSGCGKTTLLNIIGGLDRYTSGDLILSGLSTSQFKDKDWDAYRNRSIGFVFQTYNLIRHQSVLQNVEIAMTLSGVSASERKRRAKEALSSVGLADQMTKRPSQLSGGQMQRVAIARALVNNPDIILADEPTGALDSHTSVQVLEILKEISKTKLVIMVTHNSDLANTYSSRIIHLLDGEVQSDSHPIFDEEPTQTDQIAPTHKGETKTAMSLSTAAALSFKNLLSKRGRTIITSVAGSIGIIGVALVLALSNGLSSYLDTMQSDMLSGFPITVSETVQTLEMGRGGMDSDEMSGVFGGDSEGQFPTDGVLHGYDSQANSTQHTNVLTDEYIDYVSGIETALPDSVNTVSYSRGVDINLLAKGEDAVVKYATTVSGQGDMGAAMMGFGNVYWGEMPNNEDFILSLYDLIGEDSRIPSSKNEVAIVVDEYNRLDTRFLEKLGMSDGAVEFSVSDFVGKTILKVVPNNTFYTENAGGLFAAPAVSDYGSLYSSSEGFDLTIVGVLRIKPDKSSAVGYLSEGLIYTTALTDYIVDNAQKSDIALAQQSSDTDVITNMPFTNEAAKEQRLLALGADTTPTGISIYPTDFSGKDKIKDYLDEYNVGKAEADQIIYSDIAQSIGSSISSMISTLSYVLIGFAAISLLVSTIMIAIITYVSVIERTKEIGILRSVGARKRDISHVFIAETLIIGLAAGILGVGLSYLLTIPINLVISSLAGISNIAMLAPLHGILLVLGSMLLTLIAGLIPSRMAANKDPVVALRTE
ncbi:MAG: ATP-binding cassette domain-containing protein [Propionibacteriaceae bacterium]|nr:ATP-binding cassette domain-containing protein [Propionibacteriaceae bacterium]